MKKTTHAATLAALCMALAGCSGGTSNSRLDYKEAKPLPGLEVPPDLTAPVNTGLEEIPRIESENGGIRVLPRTAKIHVRHDGTERWLRIDIPAEQLWPKLRDFWPTLGLELAMDKPKLGIMETAWAENRADTPNGFFARMVKKVFKNAYSADTRDKYRLRLEPYKGGKVELFLTHYGLKEVITGQSDITPQTAWVVRPSDPELANEVMNRLVLFLGGGEKIAKEVRATPKEPVSRASLKGDVLIVKEGFARTWRLTGIALDRLGLVVDDRNRSKGLYYVSKINLNGDESVQQGKGLLADLFASGEKGQKGALKRQIKVRGSGQTTRITVRDQSGNPDHSPAAKAILKHLQEALK